VCCQGPILWKIDRSLRFIEFLLEFSDFSLERVDFPLLLLPLSCLLIELCLESLRLLSESPADRHLRRATSQQKRRNNVAG